MSTAATNEKPMAPTGRPRAPEVTEAIINATIDLLATGGVEAVSIDAIAKRAGVGRPAIYRRWSSLEGLIGDVIVMASERDIPVPDTGSVRSDLIELLHEAIAALSDPLGRAAVAVISSAVTEPATVEGSPTEQRRRESFRVIIERAKARGELPECTDADVILDLTIAPLWNQLLIWHKPLSSLDAAALVDTVLYGAANAVPGR